MTKSKTKVYFWLKIDKHFFNNLVIKKLRTIASGDSYVLIYIELMLESLEDGGVIYFENTMDNIYEEIAMRLGENVTDVKFTMDYFQKHGLIQIDEEQNAEMLQVPALLAQETNMARYQRKHRQKKQESLTMSNPCQTLSNNGHTEKELELEIELDKELEEAARRKAPTANPSRSDFNIFDYYQQRIGVIDGKQVEHLRVYLEQDGLPVELIKIAIDKGADNNRRKWSYINSILRNWVQNGIKTVAQQAEEQRQYEESKANKQGYQGKAQPKTPNVPEWSNPDYKNTTTAEEKAAMQDLKADLLSQMRAKADDQ